MYRLKLDGVAGDDNRYFVCLEKFCDGSGDRNHVAVLAFVVLKPSPEGDLIHAILLKRTESVPSYVIHIPVLIYKAFAFIVQTLKYNSQTAILKFYKYHQCKPLSISTSWERLRLRLQEKSLEKRMRETAHRVSAVGGKIKRPPRR